jgi:hypothetical protein
MSIITRALSKAFLSQRAFELFQEHGIHVTRKHFYSPIPDTNLLKTREDLWEEEIELVGVDLNVQGQLRLLENVFSKFQGEYNFPLNRTSKPYEYYINNGNWGFVSAAVQHAFIRHFAPRTIIEVGSGNSTYVSAKASLTNVTKGLLTTKLISIDPYPNQIIKKGFPGLSELISKKVEELELDFFSQLSDRDILFIDSTHVVRIGGDVNFLYLKVLPNLKKGVIVHVHDIFFPKHYPRNWVLQDLRFWTEQYLLQAFLTFNKHFEVLWCGSFMYLKYPERLKSTFRPPEGLGFYENYFSSSFWMRKIE